MHGCVAPTSPEANKMKFFIVILVLLTGCQTVARIGVGVTEASCFPHKCRINTGAAQ